ncbi:hypothetical protein PR048_015374 [Dryococelus australis]|uniref:DNA helicase Pif1-like 2B domain-containing protein n=1 Tax=Dryococelus australis TaxID=614101 RepID=A0ABQ9HGS0_9NEOP|nr:hypothetical protein PR048_015374 [Dryococelus australis]
MFTVAKSAVTMFTTPDEVCCRMQGWFLQTSIITMNHWCLYAFYADVSCVNPVHDKVTTFEINLRKKSLPLPACILTGALNGMRPVRSWLKHDLQLDPSSSVRVLQQRERPSSDRTSPDLGQIVHSLQHLIEAVYPGLENLLERDFHWLCSRAIVSPRNDTVNEINNLIIQSVPGQVKTYKSIDTVTNVDDVVHFPQDFLNSLNPSGLPPHELSLKVGTPIMLLRNISHPNMCNGTRLLIKDLKENLIVATILTGPAVGQLANIPRIPMIPTDLPIPFKRLQFPVKTSFAITINKSQGQTFSLVGIDLRKECFSHGQLYVGLSRVGSPETQYILLPNNNRTRGGSLVLSQFEGILVEASSYELPDLAFIDVALDRSAFQGGSPAARLLTLGTQPLINSSTPTQLNSRPGEHPEGSTLQRNSTPLQPQLNSRPGEHPEDLICIVQLYDGNTARLAGRSDEPLEVRVSVAPHAARGGLIEVSPPRRGGRGTKENLWLQPRSCRLSPVTACQPHFSPLNTRSLRFSFLWSLIARILSLGTRPLIHASPKTQLAARRPVAIFIPFALAIWKILRTPSHAERVRSVIKNILQINAEIQCNQDAMFRKQPYKYVIPGVKFRRFDSNRLSSVVWREPRDELSTSNPRGRYFAALTACRWTPNHITVTWREAKRRRPAVDSISSRRALSRPTWPSLVFPAPACETNIPLSAGSAKLFIRPVGPAVACAEKSRCLLLAEAARRGTGQRNNETSEKFCPTSCRYSLFHKTFLRNKRKLHFPEYQFSSATILLLHENPFPVLRFASFLFARGPSNISFCCGLTASLLGLEAVQVATLTPQLPPQTSTQLIQGPRFRSPAGRPTIFACRSMPDDAAGRRVFSDISRLLRPCNPGAAPCSPGIYLIGPQDLDVKSRRKLCTQLIESVQSPMNTFIWGLDPNRRKKLSSSAEVKLADRLTSVQSMSRQSQCSRVLQAPSRTVGFTCRYHTLSSIQATNTSLAVVPQSPVVVHNSLRSRTLVKYCRLLGCDSIYSVLGRHLESSPTRVMRRGGLRRQPVPPEHSCVVARRIGNSSRRDEVCDAIKSRRCRHSRDSQEGGSEEAASASFRGEGEVGLRLRRGAIESAPAAARNSIVTGGQRPEARTTMLPAVGGWRWCRCHLIISLTCPKWDKSGELAGQGMVCTSCRGCRVMRAVRERALSCCMMALGMLRPNGRKLRPQNLADISLCGVRDFSTTTRGDQEIVANCGLEHCCNHCQQKDWRETHRRTQCVAICLSNVNVRGTSDGVPDDAKGSNINVRVDAVPVGKPHSNDGWADRRIRIHAPLHASPKYIRRGLECPVREEAVTEAKWRGRAFALGEGPLLCLIDLAELRKTSAQRLGHSPPSMVDRVPFPARSIPGFRTRVPCRTMPLVGWFSRGYPASYRPCIPPLQLLTAHCTTADCFGSDTHILLDDHNFLRHRSLNANHRSCQQNIFCHRNNCTQGYFQSRKNANWFLRQTITLVCSILVALKLDQRQFATALLPHLCHDLKFYTEGEGGGGQGDSLLASHQILSGFNPRPGHSGFLHVGIVPNDAVCRRVFSGISRFPRSLISVLFHTHLNHPYRLSRPRWNSTSAGHAHFIRGKEGVLPRKGGGGGPSRSSEVAPPPPPLTMRAADIVRLSLGLQCGYNDGQDFRTWENVADVAPFAGEDSQGPPVPIIDTFRSWSIPDSHSVTLWERVSCSSHLESPSTAWWEWQSLASNGGVASKTGILEVKGEILSNLAGNTRQALHGPGPARCKAKMGLDVRPLTGAGRFPVSCVPGLNQHIRRVNETV